MKINVAQRVVIMGNEGSVRDQLVNALSELGVTPIWVGKPVQSNPERLAVLNPNRIVVSLEPSIELELEPYSDFLSQQTLTVLYDDAETTRALSGWDLSRWARHMAAKLLNKEIMPNGQSVIASSDEEVSEIGIPWGEDDVSKRTGQDEQVQNLTNSEGIVSHSAWQETEHYETLEIDSDELNKALELLNANLSTDANEQVQHNLETEVTLIDGADKSDLSFEFDNLQLPEFSAESSNDSLLVNQSQLSIDSDFEVTAVEISPAFEFDIAAPQTLTVANPAPLELTIQPENEYELMMSGLSNQTDNIPSFDLSKYTLLGDEQDVVVADDSDNTEHKQRTMWLVLSGLGGPVAMREMLGKVKADFTGIIVIAHDLNSEQLPKLRDQLQKITKVPLLMPETDEFLRNAHIYLLTNSQTIQNTSLGYQCISGNTLSGYLHQMDHDVEIVILSGGDPLLSQSLIQVSSLLQNIHVQPPEDCFEPSLAQNLVNIGAPVISQDVLEQWFN